MLGLSSYQIIKSRKRKRKAVVYAKNDTKRRKMKNNSSIPNNNPEIIKSRKRKRKAVRSLI